MRKKKNEKNSWDETLSIGVMTGIRSMAGLRHALEDPKALRFIAWGEAISDKLPGMPARTQAISLLARATFAGWAASKRISEASAKKKHAAAGAVAAVAAAFVASSLRKGIGRRSTLLGMAGGFAEDWVVTRLQARVKRHA